MPALIRDDTRALVDSARRDGQQLLVGSGFRSQAYQAAVFAAQVRAGARRRDSESLLRAGQRRSEWSGADQPGLEPP
ncbi:MAG: D-alanyl-D-alanine carboxypeptidase family protein [Chloroflexi bacterium]|nr:D-alanyl-D-alanine carboxypeptidase family protein [Chloroflexota bacterium]